MRELIILKIGGSVITDKFAEKPKVDRKNLRRIAREIALAYKKKKFSLVLIHGVGSFGHLIVSKTGIDKGVKNYEQLKAFAETQRLQNELNTVVTKYLMEEDLPAIPQQASSIALMRDGRIAKMFLPVLKGLLELGAIPVLYGVPAYDKKEGCSILSGDQIAPYLGAKLGAKRIIHATNVGGVFTDDPNLNPDAKLIPEINSKNISQVRRWLRGSLARDVTGGMLGKISKLLEVGVESQIINALVPGNIARALGGERIGTIIRVDR
jgi:isopentenyl phosphate kinase